MQLGLYNYVLDREDPQVRSLNLIESGCLAVSKTVRIPIQVIFPVGTFMAVMQPYMRHTREDPVQGHLILRCDNPQVQYIYRSSAF